MIKKYMQKEVFAVVLCAVCCLLFTGCIADNYPNSDSGLIDGDLLSSEGTDGYLHMSADTDSYVDIFVSTAYSQQGILTFTNGPLRFIDAESGETEVLCDIVECIHEPLSSSNLNPSCPARLPGITAAALYKGQLVLICKPDDSYFSIDVFTSDYYGQSRNRITRLDDLAEEVNTVMIRDGLLIFSYTRRYALDDVHYEEELEMPFTGLAVVDLESGDSIVAPEKSAYGAGIDKFYIKDGILYYILNEHTVPVDWELRIELSQRAWMYDEWKPYLEYLRNTDLYSLYRYDMSSHEETLIWHSNGEMYINGFTDNYALAASAVNNNALRLISLDDGTDADIAKADDSIERWWYSNDYELYIVTKSSGEGNIPNTWHKYDFAAGQIAPLFEEKQSEINISRILPGMVYIYGYDEKDEFFEGVLEREDFQSGNFDAFRVLFYPNEEWE